MMIKTAMLISIILCLRALSGYSASRRSKDLMNVKTARNSAYATHSSIPYIVFIKFYLKNIKYLSFFKNI